ncbi:unnamed protein product [Closterium sp. NIES-54]
MSIYGLKQAPCCWYQKLAAVLEEIGFRTSSCDESLFLKGEGEKLVLFMVYVDDILLFSSSMKEIQKVQQQLMKSFKCKTLGEVKYYLGMHVERDLDHRWLKLHQEKFIKELGEKCGIENERKVATPLPAEFKLVKAAEDEGVEVEEQQQFQSLVGSLLYAAVQTRPDISFSVGQLARVVQNPSEEQVDAAERVVKYLNSHPSIGVQYSASAQVKQKGVENFSRGNLAFLKALRASFDIARSQLNPIDGLYDTLRDVQGTLAVLTKSLLIPLFTNSDPRIGAGDGGGGGGDGGCGEGDLERHLLAAETSVVAVGAARGTLRPPFFEGCSPSPLSPSFASATAADVFVTKDVGAASTSAKRHNSKGKGGRGAGGGSGGGGGGSGSGVGGSGGGGGGSGGGGGGGTGGGSGGSSGGGGGSGGSGGSGGGGTGGGRSGPRHGGPGGDQRRQQQCRSETQSPQQLREWLVQRRTGGGSETFPYVIRTGVHCWCKGLINSGY